MGEKLVVGPNIGRGLRNDRTAFVIDNDSFPTLVNAYQWRGRIKRKRGTSALGRLTRNLQTGSIGNTGSTPWSFNIYSVYVPSIPVIQIPPVGDAQLIPGSVTITISTGPIVFTDQGNGTLTSATGGNSGTINYSTGNVTLIHTAGAGVATTASFSYYPDLPVMGLEELVLTSSAFPGTLAFDTTYSYNISTSSPYSIYDVSFYKNPTNATYPGYTAKTNWTPTTWNGEDYQQFWTVNYQGALWATNGINVPFSPTNIGMQYKPITTVDNITGGPPAFADLTITGHGLVVGDFVFINEVLTTTGINLQTGYVTAVVNANKVTVEFPNATIATNGSGGIAQYLTNRADTTKDCLRWYDGDPTTGANHVPGSTKGWVNFAPPLASVGVSIDDTSTALYYLVGARMIIPFKDRLLFIGPVIQTSSAGSQMYLQDTVIYSQNGTPFYTTSFPYNTVVYNSVPTTIFNPILTPSIGSSSAAFQTATPNSYFSDISGFGGFVVAGIDQPILTVASNEDVLIMGFTSSQVRFVYTGNDLNPFLFYIINSELGSASTFSSLNLDRGVISVGDNGIILTSQTAAQRIDLDIPDQIFQFTLNNNGFERTCAQRDFVNEWIYFTYLSNELSTSNYLFPNQTLQYNYRDSSWAIFNECYTTYGRFRRTTGYTWATIGNYFPTWESWNNPWNAGSTTLLQPQVIAGNQQGFVIVRDDGTNEANSLYIQGISTTVTITGITQASSAVITANNSLQIGQRVKITGVVGMTELNNNIYNITAVNSTTITINVDSTGFTAYISGGTATTPSIFSPNHCLNNGDYIVISGAIGVTGLNGNIYSVDSPSIDDFYLSPLPTISGTYLGGGLIKRMYVPNIQTKQFPVAWDMARKTRIGTQQYLLSTTPRGQITLFIYLSQDGSNPYNRPPIVPSGNVTNSSLEYSTVLYTCPESTNLGLTPANVNLQMPTAMSQSQIWHRINTSLIGDTVQLGFTMSDAQMRDTNFSNQFSEIELHTFILDISPSQMLS
tara:strand:- start:8563 stop:11589 length:3027 start_codon:yes stop_codon:yes gene_type:complete